MPCCVTVAQGGTAREVNVEVSWTVVVVTVVELAIVVVWVTVEVVMRQEQAEDVAAREDAFRQLGAVVAARLSLLLEPQLAAVIVVVVVPPMKVDVEVLDGAC